jgi:hypothetical protein
MRSVCFRVLCLLLVGAPLVAHADTTYDFQALGTGFESSGTLTVSPSGTSGVFDITGVSGEVNGTAITGLIPGSYDASNPTHTSDGAFFFDNLFYTPAPYFDYNGIGLNVGSSGYQFNFYYNGSAYETWDSNNDTLVLDSFTISAAPTPEPSSLLLLGTGMIAAAGAFRRRFI